MNCRQALKHLYEVIDKEASELDVNEVERHLKNCRHCMAQYEFEKAVKTVIVEKGSNAGDVTRVKDNIMAKLDAIDAAGEVGENRTPFKWHLVAMASAAVVVLCIIAAVSLSGLNDSSQTADIAESNPEATTQAVEDHIPHFINAHLIHSNGTAGSIDRSNPLEYLFEQTGIRLEKPDKFPLEAIQSVTIDTIMGIQFGCIEMLNQAGQLVTIFMTTADKYNLPANPIAVIDGREMVVHRCQACTMVGLEKKDLIYMVVADPKCEPKELVEVASFF